MMNGENGSGELDYNDALLRLVLVKKGLELTRLVIQSSKIKNAQRKES